MCFWNCNANRAPQGDMAKELALNKKLRHTKDGKGLIPKLEKLKEYVETSLPILSLGSGKLTEIPEEINKLRTELNMSQNARALLPHFALPRQPAEVVHTVMFCPHLTADLDKKFVFKQGPHYYYPNQEPIPTDAKESIRDLVRKYAEKTKMPTTSLISSNRWEMWSLLEMHYGEDDKDNHLGFGLQKSQQLGNKGKPSYPGAWVIGDSEDESSNASGNLDPAKNSGNKPEKNAKLGGGVLRRKIIKQRFTLTLEELLFIAPNFIQGL
ncbi:hypothetical protein VP01_4271g1 [Puccinia sorghi]|uniref:Uncharacterized protein n=1 Tax=Puccinia sorghi TaxID=27349 RepID=A0A0L6US95_9BASI|nr:hypothetical protein VP01_4271g1 [Puccinia sorghi]